MRQDSGEVFRLPSGKAITGTLLWYYAICKREVWLMAHSLTPDEEHYALDFGRVTHEVFYQRMKKEIEAEGIKIDLIKGKEKVICEVKTSSKFLDAATLQLAYYLYRLHNLGIEAKGEILIPRSRERILVNLDDGLKLKVEDALKEITEICSKTLPPPPQRCRFCSRCAYYEFCWG